MRAAPRLDSLENPPREARKLLKIRSEYFHPPLRDAAHAHSSRHLCLDGSIGQQAPREVSARHARVRAPRLRRWATPRALRIPMGDRTAGGTACALNFSQLRKQARVREPCKMGFHIKNGCIQTD